MFFKTRPQPTPAVRVSFDGSSESYANSLKEQLREQSNMSSFRKESLSESKSVGCLSVVWKSIKEYIKPTHTPKHDPKPIRLEIGRPYGFKREASGLEALQRQHTQQQAEQQRASENLGVTAEEAMPEHDEHSQSPQMAAVA